MSNNSKYKKKSIKNLSVAERREKIQELDSKYLESKKLEFAKAIAQLNIAAGDDKVVPINNKFNKESYRRYIQNMAKNTKELREMSNFLARVSLPYRRLIKHFADAPLFYWLLTPQITQQDKNYSPDKILASYIQLLKLLDNMSIENEMRNVLNTVLREGVFFGYIYQDKNSFFIHKLDPDFCKIREISGGCFNFQFDFAYFDRRAEYLLWLDPEFNRMYNAYLKNKQDYRFQILDPAKTICIKSNPDQPNEVFPPFVGLFEALLDLIDARALQRNKDKIENYKVLIQKIPMLTSSKRDEINNFALNLDLAQSFYNQLSEVIPENVGVALSPMDIEPLDFNNDRYDKPDIHAAAMRSVFDESGISQSLFNASKLSSEGLRASILTDMGFVWEIIESIERWIRRYVYFNSKGNQRYNFEILRVDIFNRFDVQKSELALANSGVPNKLRLAASSGLNPLTVVSNQLIENEVLNIQDNWLPLKTSYTMSDRTKNEVLDSDIRPNPDDNHEKISQDSVVE